LGIAGVSPAVFGVPPKTSDVRTMTSRVRSIRQNADWGDRDGRDPH
jgi:hypothetical protein